jgi:hypothetical protein
VTGDSAVDFFAAHGPIAVLSGLTSESLMGGIFATCSRPGMSAAPSFHGYKRTLGTYDYLDSRHIGSHLVDELSECSRDFGRVPFEGLP